MSRRFSKKDRNALFLAADGKSEKSGAPLLDWHADHIVPWSLGGPTDVSNGQALTREENMEKSNIVEGFRAWQIEFINDYLASGRQDYMLAALPGAGKTRAALACAQSYLDKASHRRVVVVCPTSALRKQWRDVAFAKFGLDLQTKEFAGSLKNDFHGVVTTYAAIAAEPTLFRRLCAMHNCMVIFDEIHHAGDKSAWGIALQNAFENAERRLCLSGTPFKHDGQKIPFLRIEPDGRYHIDYSYDYPTALRDGVVRDLSFHHYAGEVEVVRGEDVLELSTEDSLNEDDTSLRLRGLLRSHTFTKGILQAAHGKLVSVRREKPDAGALAICIDANHASVVARLLEDVTGEAPEIVVSDTELTTTEVDVFSRSNKKWIVSIKMVSEGVDIPRLMVLSYLTNTTTELFFRQAVGRIVRSQGTDFDTEAYCFLPDDPRLRGHASIIEKFQEQVLTEEDEEDDRTVERRDQVQQQFLQILGASEARLSGITLKGTHERDDASIIRELSEELSVPENKIAVLIERLGARARVPISVPPEPEVSKEARMQKWRKQCQKLAFRLAKSRGCEPKEIHLEYMKIANVNQANMTENQLEGKHQWLLKNLSN